MVVIWIRSYVCISMFMVGWLADVMCPPVQQQKEPDKPPVSVGSELLICDSEPSPDIARCLVVQFVLLVFVSNFTADHR